MKSGGNIADGGEEQCPTSSIANTHVPKTLSKHYNATIGQRRALLSISEKLIDVVRQKSDS